MTELVLARSLARNSLNKPDGWFSQKSAGVGFQIFSEWEKLLFGGHQSAKVLQDLSPRMSQFLTRTSCVVLQQSIGILAKSPNHARDVVAAVSISFNSQHTSFRIRNYANKR